MIQPRRGRHRKRKRTALWITLSAAVVAGVCVTAAIQKMNDTGIQQLKPPAPAAAGGGGGKPGGSEPGAGVAGSGAAGGTAGGAASQAGSGNAAAGKPSQADGGAAGQAADGPRVRMAFVGDVLLADGVEKLLLENGYDYPYGSVKQLLSEPDVTVANLETPVTEGGTKQTKQYVYRSSPKTLPALKESGVDLLNLANNHIMDYGAQGMIDTMSFLDREGMAHVGTGRNLAEALKPVIITKQGIKIAFLGFSRVVENNSWKANSKQPGVADTYNYTVPLETIRKAKEQADLVVVLAHWGTERKDTPDPIQADLAHRYVDAGADLVVASHPHVLQGVEAYNGKWIAYSLGNFIFTTNDVPKTWDTVVLQADCAKTGDCSLKAVPVLTKWAKPEPIGGIPGSELLKRLSGLSFRSKIAADGSILRDDSIAGPQAAAPASTAPAQPANNKKK